MNWYVEVPPDIKQLEKKHFHTRSAGLYTTWSIYIILNGCISYNSPGDIDFISLCPVQTAPSCYSSLLLKLIVKFIALRFKKYLPSIIYEDQTGSIRNRMDN